MILACRAPQPFRDQRQRRFSVADATRLTRSLVSSRKCDLIILTLEKQTNYRLDNRMDQLILLRDTEIPSHLSREGCCREMFPAWPRAALNEFYELRSDVSHAVAVIGHGPLGDQLVQVRMIDRACIGRLANSERSYRDVWWLGSGQRHRIDMDRLAECPGRLSRRGGAALRHGSHDLGEWLERRRQAQVSGCQRYRGDQGRGCVHHVAAVGLDDLFGNELVDGGRENGSTLHQCDGTRQHGNHHLRQRTYRRYESLRVFSQRTDISIIDSPRLSAKALPLFLNLCTEQLAPMIGVARFNPDDALYGQKKRVR